MSLLKTCLNSQMAYIHYSKFRLSAGVAIQMRQQQIVIQLTNEMGKIDISESAGKISTAFPDEKNGGAWLRCWMSLVDGIRMKTYKQWDTFNKEYEQQLYIHQLGYPSFVDVTIQKQGKDDKTKGIVIDKKNVLSQNQYKGIVHKRYRIICSKCKQQHKYIYNFNMLNKRELQSIADSLGFQSILTFRIQIFKKVKVIRQFILSIDVIQQGLNLNPQDSLDIYLLICRSCKRMQILLSSLQRSQGIEFSNRQNQQKLDLNMDSCRQGLKNISKYKNQDMKSNLDQNIKCSQIGQRENDQKKDVGCHKFQNNYILQKQQKRSLAQEPKNCQPYLINLDYNKDTKSYYKIKSGRKFVSDRTNLICRSQRQMNINNNDISIAGKNKTEDGLMITLLGDRQSIAVDQGRKSLRKMEHISLNKLSNHRQRTQQSSYSLSNTKRSRSKQIFIKSIKSKRKEKLEKQKQNQLRTKQSFMNRLKILKNQSYYYQQTLLMKGEPKKIPWEQICELSKQIEKIKFSDYLEKPREDASNKNQDNSEPLVSQQKRMKQILIQKVEDKEAEKVQKKNQQEIVEEKLLKRINFLWQYIQTQFLSKINPLGQCISKVKLICKEYGIKNSFTPLFLIYKKFFYMRTTLLSCLLDRNQPIISEIAVEEWRQIIEDKRHNQRTQKISKENQSILKTLKKMWRKIESLKSSKQNKVKNDIWEIVIEDEDVYTQFFKQMLDTNIRSCQLLHATWLARMNSKDIQKQKIIQEEKVILEYGKGILMAALDELDLDMKAAKQWKQKDYNIQQISLKLRQVKKILLVK